MHSAAELLPQVAAAAQRMEALMRQDLVGAFVCVLAARASGARR